MESQFDSIMHRIRARQTEMTGEEEAKENEAAAPKKTVLKREESLTTSSPTKIFGVSSKSNDANNEMPAKSPVYFRPTPPASEPKDTTPTHQETSESHENSTSLLSESTTKKPSRFSMLAQELDDFQYDYTNPYDKPKEAFMKGRSPRMSIGETRPAVLCTPAGAASMKSPNIAKSSISAPDVVVTKNGPEIALGMSDFEARRIKFAQPIVNVNYLPNESSIFSAGSGSSSVNDMSTVLGGSAEMMNVTTSSLSCGEMSMNQHITHENTIINAQSCDNREAILRERTTTTQYINQSTDEYGAHTFMRKKVQKEGQSENESTPMKSSSSVNKPSSFATPSSSSSHLFTKPTISSLVSSPKPFSKDVGRAMFSPVHFTPKSTSSPKTSLLPPTQSTDAILSPSKSAALEGSVATTRRLQFEQQLRKNNINVPIPAPIPTPRHVAPHAPLVSTTASTIQNTPRHHHYAPPQQKNLFASSATKQPLVATAPLPVQTQWRGQVNTPVVQGTRADQKTAELVGAGVGKLKNLKSRWEFSSATGTPIHPDATEDSLIATAIKMKETAIPNRIGHRSINGRKGPPSASSIHSQHGAMRSNTASPAAKNLRYGRQYDENEDVFDDEPEMNTENDPIESDDGESGNEEDEDPTEDTSRFIDNAFGFIEGPGTGTPSPFRGSGEGHAPLARHEKLRDRSEIIEEEDVDEVDEEEEEEAELTEIHPKDEEKEAEPTFEQRKFEKNESGLAYSVSFYRKMGREHVGEATGIPMVTVSPSAPPSLTSPQKLKQLTSSGGASGAKGDFSASPRVMETEKEALVRLKQAMTVAEQRVHQSQRAMTVAQNEPTFRGSRQEFEAQWALLANVEKHRALHAEFERWKREGPKIIDGPRGTVTITQLSVNMARDYVSAHIASAKKPDEVFYFIAVLRCAEQVDVSKMVTSDCGMNRRGVLEFPTPLELKAIPPDFRATIEIYGQRSMRESTTHEEKFKIKGTSTLKGKKGSTFLGGGSTSSGSANQSLFNQSSSQQQKTTSNFNLLGTYSFDINCPGKHLYNMSHVVYPLEGITQMKVQKQAVDGSDNVYRGFLSMYQRTNEGLGSWTRYWSVLEHGEMKFWRQPEDEGTKGYLVLMDLSTCLRTEGASAVQDVCPFPNSFNIEVWVENDDPQDPRGIMPLSVMLAADTSLDLQKWLSVINSTTRQLCTWRNPIR